MTLGLVDGTTLVYSLVFAGSGSVAGVDTWCFNAQLVKHIQHSLQCTIYKPLHVSGGGGANPSRTLEVPRPSHPPAAVAFSTPVVVCPMSRAPPQSCASLFAHIQCIHYAQSSAPSVFFLQILQCCGARSSGARYNDSAAALLAPRQGNWYLQVGISSSSPASPLLFFLGFWDFVVFCLSTYAAMPTPSGLLDCGGVDCCYWLRRRARFVSTALFSSSF